jgi:Rrf2 family protein
MKITLASSYAIHAIAYMAQSKQEGPIASHKVARAQKIPERFLLKVLKPLVAKGVLISVKGPHGGYRLAKDADEINLREVIEAVEGDINGIAPRVNEKHNAHLNQRVQAVCTKTAEVIRKELEKVKLSDLLAKR